MKAGHHYRLLELALFFYFHLELSLQFLNYLTNFDSLTPLGVEYPSDGIVFFLETFSTVLSTFFATFTVFSTLSLIFSSSTIRSSAFFVAILFSNSGSS